MTEPLEPFHDPTESSEVESGFVVRVRAVMQALDALLSAGLVGEARRLLAPYLTRPEEARAALTGRGA